ncbi:MAG: rRNA adenine dimethyltransferase family protein [Candidatus Moraniibacteriota bacterium]
MRAFKRADQVLEVGPGLGVLTEALAQAGAKVTALEIDRRLITRLNERFRETQGVSILEGNILQTDLGEMVNTFFSDGTYQVVANIPYYITAPIIRLFLTLPRQPKQLVLMVQNEVAERLGAPIGSMSLLSVMAQYYSEVEKCLFVPRASFEPVPKVDSAIVRIVPQTSL